MNPVVTNPKLLISFLHQTTTAARQETIMQQLLLISFLHQTTTNRASAFSLCHCFLSHFYIKPQQPFHIMPMNSIASYLISTSNHNHCRASGICVALLLISFLHQTTTTYSFLLLSFYCFLSHFYIKPQLSSNPTSELEYCFLSHFYIKPQPQVLAHFGVKIASYLISTSNHNLQSSQSVRGILLLISFLHQTTT